MTIQAPEHAIQLEGLCKTYQAQKRQPAHLALDDVSLNIPRGSFFGLLGPNGAGKSTLINILAGLVIKSSGTARVCGYDIETDMREARRSIGVVPQELNMDPYFTPFELLDLYAGLYGVARKDRRTDEILEAVGLADKRDSYSRSLSGGMRRRLLVGKAMVHSPPILVLDEPTAGVDVELRHQLWEYVRRLNDQGTTVLLTTHYLEEAENLCRDVAIIDEGVIIEDAPMSTVLRKLQREVLILTLRDGQDEAPSLPGFETNLVNSHELEVAINSGDDLNAIFGALAERSIAVVSLRNKANRLEELFMGLVENRQASVG